MSLSNFKVGTRLALGFAVLLAISLAVGGVSWMRMSQIDDSTDQIVGQVRKLPSQVWPLIQSHWCDPKSFESMARYLTALPQSAAAVAKELEASDAFRDLPLTVLSAGNANPTQRSEHEAMARRSVEPSTIASSSMRISAQL